MSRPEIPVGDYLIAAVLQAINDDASRDALADRHASKALNAIDSGLGSSIDISALRSADIFQYAAPSAYMLRRAMGREDLRLANLYAFHELAKVVYPHEKWFVIDSTYFKSPYYEKWIEVYDEKVSGNVMQKVKNAKVFLARGLLTGVPVACLVTDDNVNDQTAFIELVEGIVTRGGSIRGGGILADAGFNKREFYEFVAGLGGRAFLDFDRNAKFSNGEFPHYDEMWLLWKKNQDEWFAYYNWRALIETTNHAVKSVKRIIRARKALQRENEVLALLIGYSISRMGEVRKKFGVTPAFINEEIVAYVDRLMTPRRKIALTALESEQDLLPDFLMPPSAPSLRGGGLFKATSIA